MDETPPKEKMPEQLRIERERSSFPIREMTYLLGGGKEAVEERERMERIIERDPNFRNDDIYFLDRPERYRRAMIKQRRLLEIATVNKFTPDQAKTLRSAVHDELGTDLQVMMFIPNIIATFSDEQQAKWLPLAQSWRVIGAYAQTEMGHGSNVRALETTSTYLPETDEFEINSPSITSIKWWPGALGRTANHVIVYARLIIHGKDYGVHNFMCQIREFDTHRPVKGISVGDIGPKIGYNNQDNGFCHFNKIRIPRENMAMRYAKVKKGGSYEAEAKRKSSSYATMTFVRSFIVQGSGYNLSKACTIATRYSVVRKQGYKKKSDPSCTEEQTVLDYTMQQYRILPLLATSYAFTFTGSAMRTLMEGGDAAAIHVASSGLKSLCSKITATGIEECRKACGGHGYLQSSGLPELLGTYLQNPTVEGENYMIAQQTAKALLKVYREARGSSNNGEGLEPVYVANAMQESQLRCTATKPEDFFSADLQMAAYKQRAAWTVVSTETRYLQALSNGLDHDEAWDLLCPEMIRLSDAHCFFVLVSNFAKACAELKPVQSPTIIHALDNVRDLFALYWMQEQLGDFIASGFLSREQSEMLRDACRVALGKVRTDAIPLVDAWSHSDHNLNSALGRYDGDVYTALLHSTRPSVNPLNRDKVSRAFFESLLPISQLNQIVNFLDQEGVAKAENDPEEPVEIKSKL